jgi:hypothetical protein
MYVKFQRYLGRFSAGTKFSLYILPHNNHILKVTYAGVQERIAVKAKQPPRTAKICSAKFSERERHF